MNFNQVTLVGRVGKDPEVKFLPTGTAVCNFSIAVSESWTKDGKKQERTDWIDVAAFGKTAELVGQYIKKGSELLVTGKLRQDKWTDKDGKNRSSIKVNADHIAFGSKPKDDGAEQEAKPDDSLPF